MHPDTLRGRFHHFSDDSVEIEQYAVGKTGVFVSVADTVVAENGGDMGR